jgi:ribosomal protein RSM22 (predicted rRNA methylase)
MAGAAWCHFLARLDRSPLHRDAKAATRSWEDEPFSYVAVSRRPGSPAPRVVLGRPRQRPGMIELRICVDGRIEQRILSRRDGPAWRTARDLAWGDPVPAEVLEAGR